MNYRITVPAASCAAFALAMGCVGGDNRLTYDESLDIEEQSVTSFTQQFASSYLNNVALPDGRRLWSSVVINNPNPTEATVTLTIRSNNGLEITPALTKKIPPDTY